MGQLLWQLCITFAEEFCTTLKPKLQAKGFLRDSAEERKFQVEAIVVHFWIIWTVCNDDQRVLDVLNNIFNGWDIKLNEARVSETLQKRFGMYSETISKDEQLRARGLPPNQFARAALQCLLNDGKPVESPGFLITSQVDCNLSSVFQAVEKLRKDYYNIR